MNQDKLRLLIEAVAAGEIDPRSALQELSQPAGFEDMEFARLDTQREQRTGAAEVIFAPGKTYDQLKLLIERALERLGKVFVSRLDEQWSESLRREFDGLRYSPLARALYSSCAEQAALPLVAVVTAGTSDQGTAEEAALALEHMGHAVDRVFDVGVAGIHRLLHVLDRLRQARVLIVVAGMEGALPSVVAGLLRQPVIAVPTSVGYGASFGGVAALLGMLNSCAGGVAVVNIDNGIGAAIMAHRIAAEDSAG